MSREGRIVEFVQAISEPEHPNLHNPWKRVCSTELDSDGPDLRKQRLINHLNAPNPRLLIVGEAPGYRGCRYSGLAFTSEKLLFQKAIPRMEGLDGERITNRTLPWSEPSATIVWGALNQFDLQNETVMFNAVPWHPEGAAGIHSNRTPTAIERAEGLKYLRQLVSIFEGVTVAALGNVASTTLSELNIDHVKLRHPANGGATKFRSGLSNLVECGI